MHEYQDSNDSASTPALLRQCEVGVMRTLRRARRLPFPHMSFVVALTLTITLFLFSADSSLSPTSLFLFFHLYFLFSVLSFLSPINHRFSLLFILYLF